MMRPIAFGDFLERTRLDPNLVFFKSNDAIRQIISLKDIAEIDALFAMPTSYLGQLLSSVTLVESPKIKVFDECAIRLMTFDPSQLCLGQKYVYRNKYIAIFENFERTFHRFLITGGISELTPFIVLGKDREDEISLAHYIPPIVERHNSTLILMDGIHRNFIVKRCGTVIKSIFIDCVRVPFPCAARPWEEIELADTKPLRQEDRFFNLKPELFRNLEAVGIDG